MRKLLALALCLISFGALAQTGSPKTTTQLNAEVNSTFPTTGQGQITAFGTRQMLLDLIASGGSVSTPGPVYNIKDFGAAGDGVTDDSTPFLNVLTACQNKAGTVYFPAGSYLVNTGPWVTVTNISGCTIQGAGPGATFIINHDGTHFPGDIGLQVGNANNSGIINYPTFFAINTPTSYSNTVTTTTASQAGNFSPGQDILVSGGYQSTSYPYPSFQTTVVSANAGTGVITLADNLPLVGSQWSQVQPIQVVKNVTIKDLAILSAGNGNGISCINIGTAKHVLVDNVNMFGGTGGCTGIEVGGGLDIVYRNVRCFGAAGLACVFDATSTSQASFEHSFMSGFEGYYKFEGGTFQSRMIGNVCQASGSDRSCYYVISRAQNNILTNNSAVNVPAGGLGSGGLTIDGGGSNEGSNVVSDFFCSGSQNATPADCIQIGIHLRSDSNIIKNVRGDNLTNAVAIGLGSLNNQVDGVYTTNVTTQLAASGGALLAPNKVMRGFDFTDGVMSLNAAGSLLLDYSQTIVGSLSLSKNWFVVQPVTMQLAANGASFKDNNVGVWTGSGTLDGVTIGSVTPEPGTFTTLTGTTINGTTITGATVTGSASLNTPSTFNFSGATATFNVSGVNKLDYNVSTAGQWTFATQIITPSLVSGAGNIGISQQGNGIISIGTNSFYSFTNAAGSSATIDTALHRNAAGIIEVDNGTAGTYRDLTLRHTSGQGSPTASACSGFALSTGSSDLGGKVTFTSATSCAISFASTYTNPPACTVAPGSAASTVEVTTTTGVLTATFGTAQTAMSWSCIGT